MTAPQPRPFARRLADTRARLATDVDAWVATAGPGGSPYLVPLSFVWVGEMLLLATAQNSPTVRNLRVNPLVRVCLGTTRDVVLIEGATELIPTDTLAAETGDAFAAAAGFDPRTLRSAYFYLKVRPHLIQAWREENELVGRDLMRDGRWLG